MILATYQQRSKFIKRLIFWSIVIGGLVALLFAQTIVSAQSLDPCQTLGGCVGGVEKYNTADSTQSKVIDFVLTIVRFLIYIGAAIAILFIVIGGYNMITSNGNPDQYKKGLNTLLYAVIGLVITIVAATIVSLIGTITQSFKLF